jgi:hypothetical protein
MGRVTYPAIEAKRRLRLTRFPAKWKHFAEKKSRQTEDLEHVLIAKARALWRNML